MNGLNCDKTNADNCPYSLLEIAVARLTPTCYIGSDPEGIYEIYVEIHGVGRRGTQDFKLEIYDIPDASLVEFEKIDPPPTSQEPSGYHTRIEWEDTMKTQPPAQRVFKARVQSYAGRTGRTSITVKLHHAKQSPPYTCSGSLIHEVDLEVEVQ